MSDQQAFWDERFRGCEPAFGTRANTFLADQVHMIKEGGRVLVPGDGEGRNGVWLSEQGFAVDSVDISPVGVAKAVELAAARGVSVNFQIADLLMWDWPTGSYDGVAALYLHFFDSDRMRMHRAMLSALKPGGLLILEAFSLAQLGMHARGSRGGPKTEDMLFSKEKLAADFEEGNIKILEEMEITLDEGHRHRGPAAIVRALIERK